VFRPTSEPIDELLASSHRVRTRAECWRGDVFLGTAPVLSGSELSEAADQFVACTVDLDVAQLDESGASWLPVNATDALNVFGSRIYLSYDVARASGEWLPIGLGWFIVDEWEAGEGVVSVSALDVRDALRTAKLLAPSAPAAGGTFVTELKRLVGGRLPLDLTAAPVDRAVPSGMAWAESRAEAIDELMKAWPARAELDADGTLVILGDELDELDADVVLTEGVGGTVVKSSRSGTRAELYNVVVARGEDSSSTTAAPVTGYAADTDPDSPTYVDGPMGELVTFFASPLLKTQAQADKAAATILRRSLRTAETIPVQCLPDPRVGVNTRVDLVRRDGSTTRCVVLTSKLPLTGDGGAQSLTLGVIRNA
jgi:hypothetical protein